MYKKQKNKEKKKTKVEKEEAWTYLPFVFIQPILVSPSTTVEQYSGSNILALLRLLRPLLHETSEGRDTSPGSNHDDGLAWVGW